MTIDANIVIAYLGGDEVVIETLSRWRQEGRPLLLPAIAETEVLSFSEWTDEERKATEQFISENFTSIPFDRTLARIASVIRRQSKIKLPDATLAATALFTHTPLVTRNVRDFKRISHLSIIQI